VPFRAARVLPSQTPPFVAAFEAVHRDLSRSGVHDGDKRMVGLQ